MIFEMLNIDNPTAARRLASKLEVIGWAADEEVVLNQSVIKGLAGVVAETIT